MNAGSATAGGGGTGEEVKPASRPAALAARYRSLFVIGRGGMGSVEAALEIEPPDSKRKEEDQNGNGDGNGDGDGDGGRSSSYERVVALKRLLPDAARDKRRVEMFLREARLAAMLDHPNVVSAYDYGEIDGELYLAMEYVEGQPLSRLLKAVGEAKEKLPLKVVLFVLAEVCRGLHAAHELADPKTKQPLQLVHRDVSPQNVMIGYDGRVRLLDFGVAKIETESHTKTGEVKGKTAYMSPEQAMGDALDRRSDLFGVGAILFECLALRRMWGDGTDMEVIRKLALEHPPPLSDTGAVDLPEKLSALYSKLIARDAKDRPKDAAEVASALIELAGDSEEANRTLLRDILQAHFADQAKEQRARLTSSLHEVAPKQADALRESVLPTPSLVVVTPITQKKRDGTPSVIAVHQEPTKSAAPNRAPILAALGVAAVAVAIWRFTSSSPTTAGDPGRTPDRPLPAQTPSTQIEPPPSTAATLTATGPTTTTTTPAATTTTTTTTTTTPPPKPTAPPMIPVSSRPQPTASTKPAPVPQPSASVKPINDTQPF